MSLYKKLKNINWINYYILGPQNNNWAETVRNPFHGIGLALGVPNINAHTVIDLRLFYIPFERVPRTIVKNKRFSAAEYKYYIIYNTILPSGVKKTLGKSFIKLAKKNWVIFEIRHPHPVDAIYYNAGIAFSFNLVNRFFPWISLTVRLSHSHYLNCGIGWKGTNSPDNLNARFGAKFRIANYDTEVEWNNGCVAPAWYEGHV